jgi:hypothetical protein
MKKILLILLIVLSTYELGINEFSTEPFIEMNFNDEDSYKFKLYFDSAPEKLKVFLVNGTNKCEADCNNAQESECTIIGNNCQADKDNKDHKFYYAVRYNENGTEINVDGTNGEPAYVTVCINEGNYIKSLFVLICFILF